MRDFKIFSHLIGRLSLLLPNNKFTKQATNGVYLKMSEITEFSSVWIEFDSARFESYSEEVELSSEGT